MSQVIAAVIAAATALVAVIIGPFVTIYASKRAILGPMRQAWINSLRDTVAEYLANVQMSVVTLSGALSEEASVRHAAEAAKANQIKDAFRLKEKICLLINPRERDHRELVALVERAYTQADGGRDPTEFLAPIREITQKVLKAEWEVVKK